MVKETKLPEAEVLLAIKDMQQRHGVSANLKLAQLVVSKVKELFDSPEYKGHEFGELIRLGLNEYKISGAEQRQKYAWVAGAFFSRRRQLSRHRKQKKPQLPTPKKTAPLETQPNGQLRWNI